MADDPYATLGVSKNASEEDIRRAFRKLAKELHPDVSKGNEERFRKVTSAYEIVGDAEKRRAYDRGEIDARGDPRHAGFRQYARGARAGAGAGAGGPEDFGFSDIFSDIFSGMGRGAPGAGARANFTAKGQDVRYTLDIDFLEAVLGATKRVTLPGGGMLDLNVPAGVTDAQVLRLKGKGQRVARTPSSSERATTSSSKCRSPSTRPCSARRSRCRPYPAACNSPFPKARVPAASSGSRARA